MRAEGGKYSRTRQRPRHSPEELPLCSSAFIGSQHRESGGRKRLGAFPSAVDSAAHRPDVTVSTANTAEAPKRCLCCLPCDERPLTEILSAPVPAPEKHPHSSGSWLREIVFGLNDGLVTTLVFIMAASMVATTHAALLLVIVSEISAGGISMALGGFLSAETDRDLLAYRIATERNEIATVPRGGAGRTTRHLSPQGDVGRPA